MSKRSAGFNILLVLAMCFTLLFGCSGGGNKDAGQSTGSDNSAQNASDDNQSTEADSTGSDTTSSDATSSDSSGGDETASKELYTIKVFQDQKMNVKTSDETEIGQYMKDKFGIVFELIPFSGDYVAQTSTMLASNDYPELMRLQRNVTFQNYLNAGVLLPLDPYIKEGDSFNTAYKDLIPYWRMLSPDNKLYKWEYRVPTELGDTWDILVRTDAIEKQGWPKLVSEDDYVAFFKKALEDMPKSNGKKTLGLVAPFGESWGGALAALMYDKGGDYVWASTNTALFNTKTEKYESYIKNPYVKQSFQFFNRLYREGILDKDSFTDKFDNVVEKVKSGQALAAWYVGWLAGEVNAEFEKSGKQDQEYIHLGIRLNSQVQNHEKRLIKVETTRDFDTMVITNNAKHPERIMELVNWAASPEGQTILQSGFEGKHYTIENGKRVPTEELKKIWADPDNKSGIGTFAFLGQNKSRDVNGQFYDLRNDPDIRDQMVLTQRMRDAFQNMGYGNSSGPWELGDTNVVYPMGLTNSTAIDPQSELGALQEKMVELLVRSSSKLIKAKDDADFEKVYNSVVAEYDKMQSDRVVDEFNKLYAESKAKLDAAKQ
jgi:putative aldouronate transport system substrate-binding protein